MSDYKKSSANSDGAKSGGKNSARLPRATRALSPAQIDKEVQNLRATSRWRFSDTDIELFWAIRTDPEASAAFDKLTRGRKAISPAILLLNLGLFPKRSWDGWERWHDKWKGLASIAKSLRLLDRKTRLHLKKSDRGPISLPTLNQVDGEDENYIRSLMADKRLLDICESLERYAAEVEEYCDMRKTWLRAMRSPKAPRNQQLVVLLRFVKEQTGEWYFGQVAALLNVGRRISQEKDISADTLADIRKFRTPFLDRLTVRTGIS